MESEKVKEIKKVLEEGKFNTINHHQKEGKPIKISFADILTLINELEGEKERYKQSCGAIGQNSLTIINQLKNRIARLERDKKRLKTIGDYKQDGFYYIVEKSDVDMALDETLKEFLGVEE